jgi:hypothetical protein
MTAEDYIRQVEWALSDLPWSQRRALVAELQAHLAEFPPDAGLVERLGSPERYAADMRVAAGIERRRGPLAFLRARRPRNLVFVALGLVVVGLAIGTLAWINGYQPIATGNSWYQPGAKDSPAGDGVYYIFRQGQPFEYGMTIWHSGRFTVRVTGIPIEFEPLQVPATAGRPDDVQLRGAPWALHTVSAFRPEAGRAARDPLQGGLPGAVQPAGQRPDHVSDCDTCPLQLSLAHDDRLDLASREHRLPLHEGKPVQDGYAVAAPGRYGVQPDGIRGAASRMKSAGAGGRGRVFSSIPTCSSERSPLRRLHGAQAVTTFSQIDSPPFERGMMWSSVSRPFVVPQYAHFQPSRANRARREIFRWIARGTRT